MAKFAVQVRAILASSVRVSLSLSLSAVNRAQLILKKICLGAESAVQSVVHADIAIWHCAGQTGVTAGDVAFSCQADLFTEFVWLKTVSCLAKVAE